jgi:glutathione peroxidase
MKKILSLVIIFLFAFKISAQSQTTFHDYYAKTIKGDSISLSQFKGKRVLVVNTASFCGYTPQFAQLEQLYTQYKSYNFEIIGFPCNDFGSQDPYEDSIIDDFCKDNYGVTFQMMSKVEIVKGDTAPVYKWLQNAKLNGVKTVHVNWNFNKFLIDENGHWVKYLKSTTLPNDTSIVNWILKPMGINDKPQNNDLVSIYNIEDISLTFNLQNKIISEYILVDINGKILKQSKLSGTSATIQCYELPAGYYTLIVNDVAGERYFKKVVLN